jgi:hypothetical protein
MAPVAVSMLQWLLFLEEASASWQVRMKSMLLEKEINHKLLHRGGRRSVLKSMKVVQKKKLLDE